jgi:hypothetical protein
MVAPRRARMRCAALLAALLAAPGCGSEAGAPRAGEGSGGPPARPESVTFTLAQDGEEVTMRPGGRLVVALGEPGHWAVARSPEILSPRGRKGPGPRHVFVAERAGAGRVVVVDLAGVERLCGAPGSDGDATCGPPGEDGGGTGDDLRLRSFTVRVRVVG